MSQGLAGIKERHTEHLTNPSSDYKSEKSQTMTSDQTENVFQSESSSLKDASVVLYHPVVSEEYKGYQDRMRLDPTTLRNYDYYDQSIDVIQKGIKVTKYSYCNNVKRCHILKLSKNRQFI